MDKGLRLQPLSLDESVTARDLPLLLEKLEVHHFVSVAIPNVSGNCHWLSERPVNLGYRTF